MTKLEKSQMLVSLIADASRRLAMYPQYAHYFDDFVLVQMRETVRTKAGVAVVCDEYTIAAPPLALTYIGSNDFVRVWSARNRITTTVPRSAVKWFND